MTFLKGRLSLEKFVKFGIIFSQHSLKLSLTIILDLDADGSFENSIAEDILEIAAEDLCLFCAHVHHLQLIHNTKR